jgi:hypothetical protein
MKNVQIKQKTKIRTIKQSTIEEIEWILNKEYGYNHNSETKFFRILESMAVEILNNRERG